ncbi:MAG: FHA domain-containing protein [Gemmatimonadetes bacterium]|nr:FHA domain-containing protein [Gemmatimonadota bacterium]
MQLEFGGQRNSVAAGELLVGSQIAAAVAVGGDAVRPSGGSLGRLVALSDGREYPIDVVPFVLGRDPAAQVVIGSPDASRRHAEIVATPGGDVLVDLSNHGTIVNGSGISGRYQLKALDVIRIGADEFRYYSGTAPGAVPPAGAEFRLSDTLVGIPLRTLVAAIPTSPAARPLAVLLGKTGALKGRRFQVVTPAATIGRDPGVDVPVADHSVSARHARLELREGVWTLADLASGGGTWVDGEPVEDEVPLSPGAVIRLGDLSLAFEPRDERRGEAPIAASQPAPSLGEPEPTVGGPAQPAPVEPAAGGRARWLLAGAIVVLVGALAAVVLLG